MRIQLCKGCYYGSICHALHVDGIYIMLLHLLQDKVQLTPTVVISVEFLLLEHLA